MKARAIKIVPRVLFEDGVPNVVEIVFVFVAGEFVGAMLPEANEAFALPFVEIEYLPEFGTSIDGQKPSWTELKRFSIQYLRP